MTNEASKTEARKLFDQPLELVVPQVARIYWFYDNDPAKRKEAERMIGDPLMLVFREPRGSLRYFRWEQAELYTDEDTKERWPGKKSRKPTDPLPRSTAIEQLEPAEAICFNSRGQLLVFLHTQKAANIMISEIVETNGYGEPFRDDASHKKAGAIGELLGLRHGETAQTTLFNLRGQRALLLAAGVAEISTSELADIESFLLSTPPKQIETL